MGDGLKKARKKIDGLDAKAAKLFVKRMDAVKATAGYKNARGLPVFDASREEEIVKKSFKAAGKFGRYYAPVVKETLEASRRYQEYLQSGEDEVVVTRGGINEVGKYADLNRRALIVTDSGVPKEYAETVAKQCKAPAAVTLPQGETSKSIENFALLIKTMLENGFTRFDAVVAVGGGVVGDIAGFAASSYMRGIDFINVPTTLLSQVDSSVGGKTAINFDGVKNCVGAFYKPRRVIIDPDLLKTLDKRRFACGAAEIIKIAAALDEELFCDLENGALERDADFVISRAIDLKRRIVALDERESGLRRALNFGHTVGHGIESASGLLHGECVALGMLVTSSDEARARLKKLYEKYGLPTKTAADAGDVLRYIAHDKKREGDTVNIVWVERIGGYEIKPVTLCGLESPVKNSGIFE